MAELTGITGEHMLVALALGVDIIVATDTATVAGLRLDGVLLFHILAE